MSSDLPVMREVLNEANAMLLPPEQVDAWQAAVRELARVGRRRRRLAARARRDAQRFSVVERTRRALKGLAY